MELYGPVEIEIKIFIISDIAGNAGVVTIGMGKGSYPSEQRLRERVSKFEAEEMPEGFRLMTKREYFDVMMAEATGSNDKYALPGGSEWSPQLESS